MSVVSGEDNSWYPVEKKPRIEDEGTERDPSIWVLFSKTVDLEKILVRMPEDPVVRTLETGELAIRSERDGEIFEIIVSKVGSKAAPRADQLFEEAGKWVHEHVVETEQHVYTFRTWANEPESQNHKDFVASFLIL